MPTRRRTPPVRETQRPRCLALVASNEGAWRDALAERLAQAEGGIGETAVACDLEFRSEASEDGLYGTLASDGAVQILILDALAFADVRAVLARCRALRSELDVFVAVGAGDAAALEGADAALVDRDETRADTLLRRLHRAIDKRAATPFADTLRDYVEGARDAWHTPGHSSGDGLRDSLWVADFYRLMGEHVFNADLSVSVQELDSLLEPSHVIQRAQDLAAEAFGAQRTFFVTGGTSMANKVVVQHVVGGGGKVLVDQGCHKSIHHAMVLFGADPVYLPAAVNRDFGLYGPVSKESLFDAIEAHPDARLLVLTSCTYDGFYYDLEPVIDAAHAAGMKVLVDEAWYAHGRFHPALRPCALESGADFVTQSTHKTLSALSQASMIHVADPDFDEARFREDLNMHTSTSPQYGLIASLDVARKQMSLEGFQRLARCIEHARALREGIGRTTSFRVLDLEEMLPVDLQGDGIRLDPTKLTIAVTAGRGPARVIQKVLYERFSIQVEKVTHNTLSILVTLGTTQGKVLRMIKALQALDEELERDQATSRPPLLPPLGVLRQKPREAYFGATELLPLRDSRHARNAELLGRISAEQVVPYPPGIPVLVPGQVIGEETLAYLLDLLHDDTGTELHGLVRRASGIYLRVTRGERQG
jgi:arginine/lysine/ornithine decarboxylase